MVPEPQCALYLEDFPVTIVPPQVVIQPTVPETRDNLDSAKGHLLPSEVAQLQYPGSLGTFHVARQVDLQAQATGSSCRWQKGDQPRFYFNLMHLKRRRERTGRVQRAVGLN